MKKIDKITGFAVVLALYASVGYGMSSSSSAPDQTSTESNSSAPDWSDSETDDEVVTPKTDSWLLELREAWMNMRKRTQLKKTNPKATKTLLHYLNRGCSYKLVQDLIEKGADINAQNLKGNTPLHITLKKVRVPTVLLLLNSGADVHIANNEGKTPWQIVQENKDRYKKIFRIYSIAALAQLRDEDEEELEANAFDVFVKLCQSRQ